MSGRAAQHGPGRRAVLRAIVARLVIAVVAAAASAAVAGAPSMAAEPTARDLRCTALVALAEAAGEGAAGIEAVMHVIRNRIADPRFGGSACAVVLEDGQFQPVGEQPALRARLTSLRDGTAPPDAIEAAEPSEGRRVATALALARDTLAGHRSDPTHGALYFANPDLMDPAPCRWFQGLAPTALIGRHHFFTDAEQPASPARVSNELECGGAPTQLPTRLGPARSPGLATTLAEGRIGPFPTVLLRVVLASPGRAAGSRPSNTEQAVRAVSSGRLRPWHGEGPRVLVRTSATVPRCAGGLCRVAPATR